METSVVSRPLKLEDKRSTKPHVYRHDYRRRRPSASDLHLHDLLIRAHDLVSHLHEELKGKLGLLRSDGDVVELFAFSRKKTIDTRLRVVLKAFHL